MHILDKFLNTLGLARASRYSDSQRALAHTIKREQATREEARRLQNELDQLNGAYDDLNRRFLTEAIERGVVKEGGVTNIVRDYPRDTHYDTTSNQHVCDSTDCGCQYTDGYTTIN